jgi:hypothetical protein
MYGLRGLGAVGNFVGSYVSSNAGPATITQNSAGQLVANVGSIPSSVLTVNADGSVTTDAAWGSAKGTLANGTIQWSNGTTWVSSTAGAASSTTAGSSCYGIPGDPSACLSFIPVQTYTALGIAGILALLMLRRGK